MKKVIVNFAKGEAQGNGTAPVVENQNNAPAAAETKKEPVSFGEIQEISEEEAKTDRKGRGGNRKMNEDSQAMYDAIAKMALGLTSEKTKTAFKVPFKGDVTNAKAAATNARNRWNRELKEGKHTAKVNFGYTDTHITVTVQAIKSEPVAPAVPAAPTEA